MEVSSVLEGVVDFGDNTSESISSLVETDFDRIAALPPVSWDHNTHYHPFLLRQIPGRVEEALDIGCGTGEFSRLLAGRSEYVTGIDFSSRMIEVAKARSRDHPNIEYVLADVLAYELPVERYDCIASIAALHHLPAAIMLEKMKGSLRKNGTILILDLYHTQGWRELLYGIAGFPAHLALKLLKTGRLNDPPNVRQAWDAHGLHDHYLTTSEIRQVCAEVLPGAQLRRHLLWRYSIVWMKE